MKRRKCMKVDGRGEIQYRLGDAKGETTMTDPKKNKPAELAEDQLSEVSGGEEPIILVHPMRMKCCAVDPNHVYCDFFDACPECGSTEFTWL